MPVESDDALQEILDADTIAVVGCSTTPGKAAHDVPAYLQKQGYRIVPVNPFADEIDVVDVFRPSEEVEGIVDETLERDDVTAVWLQLGIEDDEAAQRAEDAGLTVVQDRCMKVEHERLV